jgi:hypothetical protein
MEMGKVFAWISTPQFRHSEQAFDARQTVENHLLLPVWVGP